jgi:hypothetical protein
MCNSEQCCLVVNYYWPPKQLLIMEDPIPKAGIFSTQYCVQLETDSILASPYSTDTSSRFLYITSGVVIRPYIACIPRIAIRKVIALNDVFHTVQCLENGTRYIPAGLPMFVGASCSLRYDLYVGASAL